MWEGVCTNIIGDVLCEGRERGDNGFGVQEVSLIDRYGVINFQFLDVQFKIDRMSVEIFDFSQRDVKCSTKNCQITFGACSVACHHGIYDVVGRQAMKSCDRSRYGSSVDWANALEESEAELGFCVSMVLEEFAVRGVYEADARCLGTD